MNGPSNQLLAGSGFPQNENGGIRRCDLGDVCQHPPQGFGGPHDLLEHRRPVDLFAQRDIFASHPLFGLLAVFDVGPCRIPANNVSLLVPQRMVADKKPTILPAAPPCSLLIFEWRTACKRLLAFVTQSLHIVRMKDPCSIVWGHYLTHREAGVIQRDPIHVESIPLRSQDGDAVRYGINDLSKLSLRLLDLLECLRERRLCSFSLDRNDGDVPRSLEQSEIAAVRASDFGVVQAKCAENFTILRNEWLGPSGAESVTQGDIPKVDP